MPDNTEKQLVLLIPGLFGPPGLKDVQGALAGLELPSLEQFLGRAQASISPRLEWPARLFQLFLIAQHEGQDLPAGAVTRLLDADDADDGWWLRADPVQVQADRDQLVLMGNQHLHLSREEMSQLADELQAVFASRGMCLHAATPRRWYVQTAADPCITTSSLSLVTGQGIREYLPTGLQARFWHGLLNEVQMCLHASTVNAARMSRGLPAISSLWFWGAGRLPQRSVTDWSAVWSNEDISRGLAKLNGLSAVSVAPGGEDWLREAAHCGRHLVVLDFMLAPLQWHNVESWRQQIQLVNEEWLQPVLAALKQGRLATVILDDGAGRVYSLTQRGARRWWHRSRRIESWM